MSHTRVHGLLLLFKETVSLYWRLTADAAAIHGAGDLSGPRRTILFALHEQGPQTVAHLARARSQTRQRLQPVINALITDGLLAAVPNPMHLRSPMMVLTADGDTRVRRMLKKEAALLARLRLASSPRELQRAARVLADARETLVKQLPGLLRSAAKKRRPVVNRVTR